MLSSVDCSVIAGINVDDLTAPPCFNELADIDEDAVRNSTLCVKFEMSAVVDEIQLPLIEVVLAVVDRADRLVTLVPIVVAAGATSADNRSRALAIALLDGPFDFSNLISSNRRSFSCSQSSHRRSSAHSLTLFFISLQCQQTSRGISLYFTVSASKALFTC